MEDKEEEGKATKRKIQKSPLSENGTGSADNVGIAIDMRRTNADARRPAVDVDEPVDAMAAFRRVVIAAAPDEPTPPPPPMPIPLPPQPPIDDDD
ncbi:unnamed protein product [Caenorhabditis nigoni]